MPLKKEMEAKTGDGVLQVPLLTGATIQEGNFRQEIYWTLHQKELKQELVYSYIS